LLAGLAHRTQAITGTQHAIPQRSPDLLGKTLFSNRTVTEAKDEFIIVKIKKAPCLQAVVITQTSQKYAIDL
jgi:hypothetical protein